jgi:hypothetical protein
LTRPGEDDPAQSAAGPAPTYGGEGASTQTPIGWVSGTTSAETPAASPATADAPDATTSPSSAPAVATAGGPGRTRLGEFIWLCLAVVDTFLALDFLLRAIAARDSGFVGVVSRIGNALASPFVGVFNRQGLPRVDHTSFWAALLAIVIYTVAAWIVLRLLRLMAAPAHPRVPPS